MRFIKYKRLQYLLKYFHNAAKQGGMFAIEHDSHYKLYDSRDDLYKRKRWNYG